MLNKTMIHWAIYTKYISTIKYESLTAVPVGNRRKKRRTRWEPQE